jgi:hypothetical protein
LSDLQIEEVVAAREDFTPSNGEDSFCHIVDGSGRRHYCGKLHPSGICTCGEYQGEAVCPTCGKLTCPTCAVMADLDDRLVD